MSLIQKNTVVYTEIVQLQFACYQTFLASQTFIFITWRKNAVRLYSFTAQAAFFPQSFQIKHFTATKMLPTPSQQRITAKTAP